MREHSQRSLSPCRHCFQYARIVCIGDKSWEMACSCTTAFGESPATVFTKWREQSEEIQIGISDLIRGSSN